MTRQFYTDSADNTLTLNTVASERVRPVFLITAYFDGSTERLCTANHDIVINSVTWHGAGDVLSISQIDETYELQNTGINISLSGLDSSILSKALTADYQDRLLEIRMAFLTTNSANGDDPQVDDADAPIIFKGRMEVMTIADDGQSCTISLTVQNRLIDFERSNESRYTHEEQQQRYSGDHSFDHVHIIQKRVLEWGA